MEPHELTLAQALELLAKKEVSSVELTQALLARMEATEPSVNAYLTTTPELALEQAQAADQARAKGEAGPLCGVPAGLKDVLCTQGVRTTCGSKILENFVPPFDAFLVARLKQAGMVLLGKHNMDEFAMGSSTENSGFGPSHNPWDLDAIPGGSSGGTAASVAAGTSLFSVGTDTGGSIRQPASHCGVVGMKPTYGRVSRFGLVAFASSLDQAGPITRTVADAAAVLQVIAGHDPADSTSAPQPVPDYSAALGRGVKGLKLGVPAEFFVEGLDQEVEQSVKAAMAVLEQQGAELVPISLPHTDYALAAYYIIAPAEASSNLARYDGVKYGMSVRREEAGLLDMYLDSRSQGFGDEVIRRIMLGTYALSAGYYDAYYGKAGQVRTLIRRDFDQAFEQVDAIVGPVTPSPAFGLGQKVDDPLQMYLSDVFTLSTNLAGLPGMSVPCGFSAKGLPIGLQIIAPHFAEETILAVGAAYQEATDHHHKRPPL
ncbi:MAG: Asp-tRNA(Asn)/Glu-tRNA(Gln) amidotransferase subunit GatA [Desulfarculaceae bacterium]|nr:Asp-tRNA(Asn)/Glu-tRNA(Gln) amidotransferase subunit GatA [Desulfarculaceae bacterium]MCF8071757.1 Asp-tRNA(Asn)/Glu-tRNA(Gln) amidotransferase subunit GatA [Desulfarculaceae bacterium]MCF8101307.1 Asp-tRNA(Asn)/Glu-tRNA(Gln) amidotransferase subunit GatA [Desulfarculaceae bacterium]MCF8117266.1 Asp-tRNA(Asn)/Glu-tRNA(Gln) amidotransferase subunit GatA [Desulfarculaceae bacterium]